MNTITIPRKVTKDIELVTIPRKEYEEFLEFKKAFSTAKMTHAQKRDLEQAREEYKRGEYMTLAEFKHALGITRKKKS